MSESGSEQTRADKKREYNRNAQRVFRQRRKEHLRQLEATQKEQKSAQSEEIETLRKEVHDLTQENENLRKAYGSQASSPGRANPSSAVSTPFVPYGAPNNFIGQSAAPTAQPGPVSTSSNMVVMVPNSIPSIRRSLHVTFAHLLEMAVMSNPPHHLATLAALGPTLPFQLHPTELQLGTAHNIYIDMIPSPSLRDRLISVGPSHADTFMAQVCTIACDIEDAGQMTVWGEDWLNEFCWEFSAEVLERWGGWLLTREWGQRANFWRRQRGAPILPAWDS